MDRGERKLAVYTRDRATATRLARKLHLNRWLFESGPAAARRLHVTLHRVSSPPLSADHIYTYAVAPIRAPELASDTVSLLHSWRPPSLNIAPPSLRF